MHGLHQEGPKVVELEVGLHHGCPDSDHRSPRVVKLVMGLHHGILVVVKLEVELHHGCPDSDHRSLEVVKLVIGLQHGSPRVVKIEVGLHQGCYIRKQEVSRGGKASNGASPPKVQEGEVHDGTSPWESQEA